MEMDLLLIHPLKEFTVDPVTAVACVAKARVAVVGYDLVYEHII